MTASFTSSICNVVLLDESRQRTATEQIIFYDQGGRWMEATTKPGAATTPGVDTARCRRRKTPRDCHTISTHCPTRSWRAPDRSEPATTGKGTSWRCTAPEPRDAGRG